MTVDPQALIQQFGNIQQSVLSVSGACETLVIAVHAMESTGLYKEYAATAKAHSTMKAALQTYMTNAERIMRQTTRDGAEGVLNDLVLDIETVYSQRASQTAHEQVRLTSTAFNSFVSVSNELVSDADIGKQITKVKAAIASDRARGGRLATGVSTGTFIGSIILGVITVPASAAAATPVLCGIAMVGTVVAVPVLTISAGTWIYQSCTTTKATRAACDRLVDIRTSLTILRGNLQTILNTISSLLVKLAQGTRTQLHAQFADATAGSAQLLAIVQAIETFQGGVQAASRAALSLHHVHS